MSVTSGKRPGGRRTPRLYKETTSVLQAVQSHEGSIKNLIYQSSYTNKKGLLSLVCKTLENKDNIREGLRKLGLVPKEETEKNSYKETLLCVLAAELVFGKKQLTGRSAVESVILSNADSLNDLLAKSETPSKSTSFTAPRYVRINTLLTSEEEVLACLQEDGWELIQYPDDISYEAYLEKISTLQEHEFLYDLHVPQLLVFPFSTEFHDHHLYTSTKILLQNKASCLASLVVKPSAGDVILDGCAAPGMKTTHMAAMMQNQGTLYCVEKSKERIETLEELLQMSSAMEMSKVKQGDFTQLNPDHYQDVTTILLDPSCSGSGMLNRLDNLVDGSLDETSQRFQERLHKLKGFQVKMLKHALSFSNVKKVVYSTCSIYEEENEAVVEEVLQDNPHFRLHAPLKGIWPKRGSSSYSFGKKCIRTAGEDLCNGSFVAEFRRRKTEEGTESLNKKESGDSEGQHEEMQPPKKKKRKKKM